MRKNKKNIDKVIREALADAPKIDGCTIEELAKKTKVPWPRERWHYERA